MQFQYVLNGENEKLNVNSRALMKWIVCYHKQIFIKPFLSDTDENIPIWLINLIENYRNAARC